MSLRHAAIRVAQNSNENTIQHAANDMGVGVEGGNGGMGACSLLTD